MFGTYPTELELNAIIRRIDTDGDEKLSYEEFADFFSSQVNEEAALLSSSRPQPPPPSSGTKKRRIKSAARHKTSLFPTK